MSFRHQINTIVILIILAIGLSSILFFKAKHNEVIELNMQSQAKAITHLIAEDLAKLIYLDDPDIASNIIRRIQKIDNLPAAYFFDINNRPLLSIHSDNQKQISDGIVLDTPIQFQGVHLGRASFVFDNRIFVEQKRKLTQFIWMLLAVMALFLVLFARFFDSRFSARFMQLSHAIQETTEKKDFHTYIEPKGNDEISQTIRHFNELVKMVREKTNSLTYHAKHDILTGLFNRQHLLEELAVLLETPKPHALCYFDLDQFKIVNDTTGHMAGDELLKQLSERMMKHCLSCPNALLGRIGGDEFLLLIQDAQPSEAKRIIENLMLVVREFEYTIGERQFRVGASAGLIYFTPNHNQPLMAQDLLSSADMACYQAKAEGRNKIVDYSIEDQSLVQKHQDMSMVSQIYKGLEMGKFTLHMQSIVDAKNPKLNQHFEVLLRLKNDQDQTILPAQFMHVVDQYGLAKKVDLWVINHLFSLLTKHTSILANSESFSINLSPELLMDKDCIRQIDQMFARYRMPYQKFTFEITENAPITNFETALKFIRYFQHKGVRFALDDFGTGMASFHYLSELGVDTLKIDGSFVRRMASNPVMQEMVKTMTEIGRITQSKVVAEQVEDEATVTLLSSLDIDYIQGFHFSKPMPFEHYLEPNQHN